MTRVDFIRHASHLGIPFMDMTPDEWEAEKAAVEVYPLVVTTNHVVAETITLIRSGVHRDPDVAHDVAVRVRRQLFAGAFGRIHHASAEEEQASFEYLAKHRDKQYSFVDCLSFVVIGEAGHPRGQALAPARRARLLVRTHAGRASAGAGVDLRAPGGIPEAVE